MTPLVLRCSGQEPGGYTGYGYKLVMVNYHSSLYTTLSCGYIQGIGWGGGGVRGWALSPIYANNGCQMKHFSIPCRKIAPPPTLLLQ